MKETTCCLRDKVCSHKRANNTCDQYECRFHMECIAREHRQRLSTALNKTTSDYTGVSKRGV